MVKGGVGIEYQWSRSSLEQQNNEFIITIPSIVPGGNGNNRNESILPSNTQEQQSNQQ